MAIGARIYKVALIILRDVGNDSNGRKINSRGTSEFGRESVMGAKGAKWKSTPLTDWFFAVKEGVMRHVLVSPYEVYEMLTEVNKEQQQGRWMIKIGTSGKKETYSTMNVLTRAIESIAGKMRKDQAFQAMRSNEERETRSFLTQPMDN